MAHAIAICCSIEAEKIEIKTRKFNMVPVMDPDTGVMRYQFQLGMNSSAWIHQEYESPATQITIKQSMTKKGDLLTGGCIDGWAWKAPKKQVGPGSASHSATFASIRGGCYAHIQTPAREHLDNPDMAEKIRAIAQEPNLQVK
ncbi:hypothetical protein AB4Y40_30160 [Paraburkholderia sp. EG287B]|uniref:hypothetical protein n=1 Tax=Paraburkholderia sp. EG287B TaxID=3237010 RepID=UPI0034D2A5F4